MNFDNGYQPESGGASTLERHGRDRGRRVRKTMVAVTVAAVALVSLPGAAFGQTPINQRFRVVSAGPPGAARTVIANGVITGVGTEVITSNPPGVATVTWTFPEGTLSVTLTYAFTNVLNPRTCLRTITLNGTWEITGGTGDFTGATGSGAFSGTNRILLNRASGSCVPPPIVLVQVFNMTGNVTLAGATAA